MIFFASQAFLRKQKAQLNSIFQSPFAKYYSINKPLNRHPIKQMITSVGSNNPNLIYSGSILSNFEQKSSYSYQHVKRKKMYVVASYFNISNISYMDVYVNLMTNGNVRFLCQSYYFGSPGEFRQPKFLLSNTSHNNIQNAATTTLML